MERDRVPSRPNFTLSCLLFSDANETADIERDAEDEKVAQLKGIMVAQPWAKSAAGLPFPRSEQD